MTHREITCTAGGSRFTLTANGYVLVESADGTGVPVAVSVWDYAAEAPTVATLPQLRAWAKSWLADGEPA